MTLAEEFDGSSWDEVSRLGLVKSFNAITGCYTLKDGSFCKRVRFEVLNPKNDEEIKYAFRLEKQLKKA